MKFVRIFLSFLALFASVAFAQTYGTINGGIATSISGGATSTANTVFDVRGNRQVSVQIGATSATTNSTLAVTFVRSNDGITYETSTPYVFTLTLSSAGTFGMVTNFDVGASGYLKLTTATAGATVPLTSTAVTVALKPGQ